MNERSYTQVAHILNTHGVWTSWCSSFLTDAGFRLLGEQHLERSLRAAGWNGKKLTLISNVDVGSGFGYGIVLIDEGAIERHDRWLKFVQGHLWKHHMNYVNEGTRTICIGKTA